MSKPIGLQKSINSRFFIVTLLPLLGITVALTLYGIRSRQTDALADLHNSGNNTASYFAAMADFPLYSGNKEMLAGMASAIARLNHVTGVIFLDSEQNPLASSALFPEPPVNFAELPTDSPLAGDYLYFKHPVYLNNLAVSDYEAADKPAMDHADLKPIGWVVLAMNMQGIQDKNRQILITSLSLSVLAALFAILLTYLLSLSILRPIRRLTETVQQMEKGDLKARAPIDTRDELSVLAMGLNRLAQTVEDNQQNLQQQVSSATRELEHSLCSLRSKNQQLEIAHETAEMANKAKSDFLARMSHELRTPITAIQGFILLLTEVAQSDAERHYCKIINQASSQLLTLIDDVLAFSKLQSNTVTLEAGEIDLAECVENVASLFSIAAQEKSLRLIVDIDPDLSLCRIGDSARIAQIVNNLVSNAVKFTARGSVTVRLEADPERPDTGIIFSVTDTGIGIASENQEQIFQAFAQADTSISRNYGGTGLGLSIVKNLIHLMNGSIDVQSEKGKGTSVRVKLALPCQQEKAPRPRLDRRVAVLADSAEESRAVVNALRRFGCDTETSSEICSLEIAGCDAVIICASPRSITDQELPENIIRLRHKTPLKLIVLTPLISISEMFTQEEMHDLQPISFLATPASPHNLYQALDTVDAAPLAPQQAKALAPLQYLNILVAEDNEFTGLLLETLIGKAGGQCRLVTNGSEVVNISHQEKFDIILMDLHMPGLNGIEATRSIRKSSERNRLTPIIALTADIVQGEEDALLEAGANDLLFKPLNENYLIERMRYAVGIKTGIRKKLDLTENDLSTEAFRGEINRLLAEIREAFQRNDTLNMREAAHQLVGIAGVFHLQTLDERACELHSAIKSEQKTSIKRLLTSLEECATDICEPAL